MGRDGIDGLDGINGEDGAPPALVFDDNITFSFNNENGLWESAFVDFNDKYGVVPQPQDVVLAYRQEGDVDGNPIWSQLPQNFFLDQGTIQYLFTFTDIDIQFIIDGNFDLSNLDIGFTDNQNFRIVFVPAEFAENFNGDFSNLKAVMSALNLKESDVQQMK